MNLPRTQDRPRVPQHARIRAILSGGGGLRGLRGAVDAVDPVRALRGKPAGLAKGFYVEPTIFANVKNTMTIAQEEIFGPVLSIIPVESLEEAIDVANDIPYGLSSAIYTRNVNNAFRAMRDLYTGIVYVNAPTLGGTSGFSRERSGLITSQLPPPFVVLKRTLPA